MLSELSDSELVLLRYRPSPPRNDLQLYNLLRGPSIKGKDRKVATLYPCTDEEILKRFKEFILKNFYLKDGRICPKNI
jgi:hypothetical protein